MFDAKFYRSMDNDILMKVYDPGTSATMASGLTEIKANDTDATLEKHVPVIEVDGDLVTVTVGSIDHPMADEHYITMIALVTTTGVQVAQLHPSQAPNASFALNGAKAVKAYEYCNIHGLWVAQA